MTISISQSTVSSISNPLQSQKPEGLDSKLQSLTDAINAGDTETAQSIFDEIVSALPEGAKVGGDDPVGQFLASVESGLSSGNLEQLQEAADTFSSITPPEHGTPPPPPQPLLGEAASESITSLISALASSDTENAQGALNELLTTLSSNEKGSESESDNPLKDALNALGDALAGGDIESAQNQLLQILNNGEPGLLISTKG